MNKEQLIVEIASEVTKMCFTTGLNCAHDYDGIEEDEDILLYLKAIHKLLPQKGIEDNYVVKKLDDIIDEIKSRKKEMTKEEFDALPRGEVFATGTFPNSPEGLYMTNTREGDTLRWVAKKGYGNDWAVYCHWSEHSVEWVTEHGDKVHNELHIRKCVPCTKEVFSLYRY